MKLPKGFGNQGGMGGMLQSMQGAMARAQNIEQELEQDEIHVDKGPVKCTFDGLGRMKKLTIDKSVVDPDDIELLEDLIVGLSKDGFEKSVELRNAKMADILPNLPKIPGLNA